MCKEPNLDLPWQTGWGYTDIKENLPETVGFPILYKRCHCKNNLIAWVPNGTTTEIIE